MREYLIKDRVIDAENVETGAALWKAYEADYKPLCLCRGRGHGIPMYIAQTANKNLVVKRMPGSGSEHDPECPSYEPPEEATGLFGVFSRAIKDNEAQGITEIRLDFALKKSIGKAPPPSDPSSEPGSSKSDGGKLRMIGLLHYLWDQAGLTRWHPHMEGKRSWAVVRHAILQGLRGKFSKNIALESILYLPDSWTKDKNDAQRAATRRRFETIFHNSSQKNSPLGVVIGALSSYLAKGNGHQLFIKHASHTAFYVPEDLHKKITSRYGDLIRGQEKDISTRLVVFATFSMDSMFRPQVQEITFMLTNERWIPIEGPWDRLLIDNLVKERALSVSETLTSHRDLVLSLARHLVKVKKMDDKAFVSFIGDKIEGLKSSDVNDIRGNYKERMDSA